MKKVYLSGNALKKQFIAPHICVIELENVDIIATSGEDDDEDDDEFDSEIPSLGWG